MWEPDPSWQRLPGSGPGSDGVWRAVDSEGSWILKRLAAPDRRVPEDPSWVGYWRREAEVAVDPAAVDGPGLVPPVCELVEEDEEGITLRSAEVVGEPPTGLLVARALGRFAAAPYAARPWATRRLLADRLAMAEQRGGWRTLARTTLADVSHHLWERRSSWLARLESGPQGRLHGDPAPRNFVGRRGADVVAVDWQCTGVGPVGTDLGYLALGTREDFEVLADAFVDGAREIDAAVDGDAIALAARVTAVYTVLSRAEWALAQAARGEGALAGKYRHPAVAPHLRAVERLLPQLETLL